MLIQLHHQWFKKCETIKTELQAQKDIRTDDNGKDMRAFCREIAKSHPVPEGAQWLIVTEKSEYFVKTYAKG